jgi:hypothetical protein
MKTIGTLFAVAALASSAPGFAPADSDTDVALALSTTMASRPGLSDKRRI